MTSIVVFARAPRLGQVKTRLAREVGDAAALQIYVAMLRDVLDKAQQLAESSGGDVVLACTPPDAMEARQVLGTPGLGELWRGAWWPQPEGDLGARMHGAISWAIGRGASAVALLGADVPDVSVAEVRRGLEVLKSDAADVVLGPARDGGFWTLACSRLLPREAFALDWNRDETREPLRANLERDGLRVSCDLAEGDDVDDAFALRRLAARLREEPQEAPRTAEWLRANGWL